MRLASRLFGGAVVALCGVALLVRADEEATCSNGKRVRGAFDIGGNGALRFVPAGQEKPLDAATIKSVRFDPGASVTPRAGNSLRLLLADGQQITGELLKLDDDQVQLRPAWSKRVVVPRMAVAALTHPPGYHTLFADDLAAGDAFTYDLPTPLDAGRCGATLRESDKAVGQFEAVFQTDKGARTLKVNVPAPGEIFTVDATGLKGESREVRRSPGPHRLAMQFTKQSLRLTCDDDVLWFNLEQGSGGTLKQVKLSSGAWSALYLARAVDEGRHPPGDADQDEAWLATNDQLFGTVHGADAGTVEFEGKFGKKSLPWADLHGIYLRHGKPGDARAESNPVRVYLRTGCGEEVDILDGVLLMLDERKFVFERAGLGQLRLERKWLREVRPLATK